jgi:hypothetical protein
VTAIVPFAINGLFARLNAEGTDKPTLVNPPTPPLAAVTCVSLVINADIWYKRFDSWDQPICLAMFLL